MIAMSGGVDSSIAAALLSKQGFKTEGVTLNLLSCSEASSEINLDILDAQNVAKILKIKHNVLNLASEFEEKVIKKFTSGYLNGITPNPCIFCNKYIKFGALLEYVKARNYDKLATGHYALLEYDSATSRYLIKKAVDLKKDQTYLLCFLSQYQLSNVIFPLSGISKNDARNLAKKLGFKIYNKPESQDICFIKNESYADFINSYTKNKVKPGNFIDISGKVIGEHKGITHYTIGQRRRLGVSFGKAMYVVAKNSLNNTVTLGEEKNLYQKQFTAKNVNFIPFDKLNSKIKVQAKIRYNHSEVPATIIPKNETEVLVEFNSPQKSITPGQIVAFYDGEYLIGGGVII